MDKKTKEFIEKATARVQSGHYYPTKNFAEDRSKEPDVKHGIKIKKTKDIDKLIECILAFDRDVRYAIRCAVYVYDYQKSEYLKFLKKLLDAHATVFENIFEFDLSKYTLPHHNILMKYFCCIILLTRYFYGVMPGKDKIQLIRNAIPIFNERFKIEEPKEQLRSYDFILKEAIFDFLGGDYEKAIQHVKKTKVDVLKYEDCDDTALKFCMFLAKLAMESENKQARFGAEAMLVLLQYQYHYFPIKGFMTLGLNTPMIMLLTYLYADIRGLSDDEIHKSLQPEQIVQNLKRLKKHNDGSVYLPKSLWEKARFRLWDDVEEAEVEADAEDEFCGKAVAFVGSAGNVATVYFVSRSHGWSAAQNGKIQNAGDIPEILTKAKEFSADADAASYCYLRYFNDWPEGKRDFFKEVLGVQPALLDSISKSDLWAYPPDGLKALLEYFYKYTLFTRYFSGAMPDRNQLLQFKSVFPVFWEKFEGETYNDPAAREFDREYFGAIEMIFDFLAGEYESVDSRFGALGADFSKFESVNRTTMKLCSCLSDIRQNRNGEMAPFGADTMLAIAQHQFYLYVLQDLAAAKTVFPFIMLLTYLHGDVRGVSEEGMHKSLQAEHILDKLDDLRAEE